MLETMHTRFSLMITLLMTMTQALAAQDIVHYDKEPILVELKVGEERILQFGDHVSLGQTRFQKNKHLLRVQSAQGALYLQALKPFEKQRFQVKRHTDGRFVLLDIVALDKSSGPLNNMRIILPSENAVPSEAMDVEPQEPAPIGPVELTRFASQRFYAPQRLHRDVPGISSAPIGVREPIKLFKGKNMMATKSQPVIGWQGGGYYIAAIHIENTSQERVTLSYSDINVPFRYATLQHHSLLPAGEAGSATMLYLISDQPLKDALRPYTYYRDRKEEAVKAAQQAAAKKRQQEEAIFDEI